MALHISILNRIQKMPRGSFDFCTGHWHCSCFWTRKRSHPPPTLPDGDKPILSMHLIGSCQTPSFFYHKTLFLYPWCTIFLLLRIKHPLEKINVMQLHSFQLHTIHLKWDGIWVTWHWIHIQEYSKTICEQKLSIDYFAIQPANDVDPLNIPGCSVHSVIFVFILIVNVYKPILTTLHLPSPSLFDEFSFILPLHF